MYNIERKIKILFDLYISLIIIFVLIVSIITVLGLYTKDVMDRNMQTMTTLHNGLKERVYELEEQSKIVVYADEFDYWVSPFGYDFGTSRTRKRDLSLKKAVQMITEKFDLQFVLDSDCRSNGGIDLNKKKGR